VQQRLVQVLPRHRLAAHAAGDDRTLVERVGELRASHARGLACHVAQVDVIAQGLVP
jgi:hypothetical protein